MDDDDDDDEKDDTNDGKKKDRKYSNNNNSNDVIIIHLHPSSRGAHVDTFFFRAEIHLLSPYLQYPSFTIGYYFDEQKGTQAIL